MSPHVFTGEPRHTNFDQVGNTVIIRCCGLLNSMDFTPPYEVVTWKDDFLQIGVGPSRIAFTQKVGDQHQHACPCCGSETSQKLRDVAEELSWGDEYACECGAEYDGEDIGVTTWSWRLTDQFSDEKLAQGRTNFVYWSGERSAPADAELIYGWFDQEDHDDNPYGDGPSLPMALIGVQLTDGTRITRDCFYLPDDEIHETR